MKNKETAHPTHPVRNFFYVLWSLLNLFAFLAFFFALSREALPLRMPILIGAGAVLALAIFFGFFRPLFTAKRR